MLHTIYLNEKFSFIQYAANIETNDKTAKRMYINDYLDSVIKSNVFLQFSEKRQNLYFAWLENLCCSLHP